ncbi:MAG: hypothetical protein ACLFTK_09050 [Anaerolineales bacterium]
MPSAEEKIIEYHISRLRANRPDVLLDAIAQLEAMGAMAKPALDALQALHDRSVDPEIKEAARQAGFNIFMAAKAEE